VALLVVQTLLVAKQRTDLHRRLGVLGALWACAVIVSGTAVQFRSLSPTSRVEWEAMEGLWQSFAWLAADNTGSFMIFGGLIAAGVLLRRRPQAHKRFMLLATFALMNAPLARIYDEFGWPIDVGPFGFFATNSVINEFMMQVAPLGFLNLVVLPFFAALVVYDLVLHRRIHSATLGGGLVLFLFQPLFVQLLALATPGVAGS
jgi:hypothetical protein